MTEPIPGQDLGGHDLVVPRAAAQRLRLDGEGVLLRDRGADQPAILLGDLTFTSVPEVLTLINAGQRSGELVLQFDVARKCLSFVDGEIVAVQSNVPDDRIGEVMWRQGIISLDQLMIAAEQLSSGKRIGRLLIDNGFIGTPQLYQGLRAQVREVFLSVFHFRSGMLCFVGRTPELATPLSLEDSTESLILAGVHQLDELNRLRRSVGSLDAEIAASPDGPRARLSEIEEAVRQLLVSARKPLPVRAILDKCHLGEFQGLKVLASLIAGGQAQRTTELASRASAPTRADPILAAVSAINTLTRALHDECKGADQWVRIYLDDLEVAGQPLFQQSPAAEACQLDADALRAAAQALAPGAVDELAAVLRDAVDFAMFQISETLDPDRAGELFVEVAPQLSATRTR